MVASTSLLMIPGFYPSILLCLMLSAPGALLPGSGTQVSNALLHGVPAPQEPQSCLQVTAELSVTRDPPEWHWSHHTHTHTDAPQWLCHISWIPEKQLTDQCAVHLCHAAATCLGLPRSKNLQLTAKALKSRTHLGEI